MGFEASSWEERGWGIRGGFEIPATWYKTRKWEFQKSAGGGAGKNRGAGQSAGTGAGRLFCFCFPKGPDLPAPVPALQPAPLFLPAL